MVSRASLLAAGTVAVEGCDGGDVWPVAVVPVAVAVLRTLPLATSVAVTGWSTSPWHISAALGASPGGDGRGQSMAPSDGSEMATELRSTLPVFVTLNE